MRRQDRFVWDIAVNGNWGAVGVRVGVGIEGGGLIGEVRIGETGHADYWAK